MGTTTNFQNNTMYNRPTPTLPSPAAPDFLEKVKTLLDLREGQTRDQDERFVTVKMLRAGGGAMGGGGNTIIVNPGSGGGGSGGIDATPPSSPTNLVITNNIISHILTWKNPAESDFSQVQIWRSETQDRTQAKLVGVATAPTETITLAGISPRSNYYYWIRAVDTSGNYSLWTPDDVMGGELVAGQFATSINDALTQLFDDTNYMTNHTIIADSFKIIQPNAGLTTGKPVFSVGNINGQPSVGIKGDLIIDGTILGKALHTETITADKIGAGAIIAGKVAANAIDGDNIQAQSSIKLLEGGKLTVGNNNIVLDSETDEIIVAPDNGTIIGEPDHDGHDYCSLKDGNISFMYWNGGEHVLYNSLKRVEMGMSIPNNVRVTIPGVWKQPPKIIVSPADIMTYNKNHNANQNLVCQADDIQRAGNSYAFTPRAYLRLTEGSTGLPISLSAGQDYGDGPVSWTYHNTPSRSTPSNTTTLKLIGRLRGASWKKFRNNLGRTLTYTGRFYMRVWIYVNGVAHYVGEWTAKNSSINEWNWTGTVGGLASGVHNYYVRLGFTTDLKALPRANMGLANGGYVNAGTEQTNQSTFTSLANGTLNYLAIGE